MSRSRIGLAGRKESGYTIQTKAIETSSYPISLDEIARRVARKNGKKAPVREANGRPQPRFSFCSEVKLDNVKEIVNEFGERSIRVDGDIPVDLPISNGDRYLFISYDQTALTHGLHKYPAKFFPELPRWLVKRYSSENETVLDPFSGSGTTNVEALLLRRNSVGIDVDPFSRFLSKVKVTPLVEDELKYCQSLSEA